MQEPAHKIIITGTGRAGTTFLVRLLTELGFDTGYTSESWKRDFHAHCNAGLEHNIFDPQAPYVVKNPALCTELDVVLSSGQIIVDYALIPVRELSAAANSRIRVGGAAGSVPGGLWMTDKPDEQSAALATAFHKLVHTLTVYEVPHAFLDFPRFVMDGGYAFAKLQPILGEIDQKKFEAVFSRVADPSLVHDFSPRSETNKGELGRAFFEKERRHRRRRAVRRVLGWCLVTCLVSLLVYQRIELARFSQDTATRPERAAVVKSPWLPRTLSQKRMQPPLLLSGREALESQIEPAVFGSGDEFSPADSPR